MLEKSGYSIPFQGVRLVVQHLFLLYCSSRVAVKKAPFCKGAVNLVGSTGLGVQLDEGADQMQSECSTLKLVCFPVFASQLRPPAQLGRQAGMGHESYAYIGRYQRDRYNRRID